jgi:hypothetical protein
MASQVVEVHRALAKQLSERLKVNNFNFLAFPDASTMRTDNKIEVWPDSGDYIDHWGTFGENGIAAVNVRLRIQTVMGDAVSAGELIAELVSCGSGAEWSIWDALLADHTLGGVAETIQLPGTVEYDVDDETYAHVAWVPIKVILRKSGAGV